MCFNDLSYGSSDESARMKDKTCELRDLFTLWEKVDKEKYALFIVELWDGYKFWEEKFVTGVWSQ